ncbi:hypothetical protein [Parafilimonas sp.]|uniref:hypothetical protein n=1 Tax=Parafilimonas sp. TaxID=1969739 RepID=UPI0039E37FE5
MGLVYIILSSIFFQPDKYNDPKCNELNFAKFKYVGNFVKWIIGSIIIYVFVAYVNDTFKNREVGIEEMKQYDTYVNDVLSKDLETKKTYALYYSIITPSDTLRKRWKAYYDTLSVATTELQKINDKLNSDSLSEHEKKELLYQRDSIKSKIQPKQVNGQSNNEDITLYRIDCTFHDIKDFMNYPLQFEIYDDGSPIFIKNFNQGFFYGYDMRGSYKATFFLTETKSTLKSQSLHFSIPVEPKSNQTSVKIKCDFKFYYYNSDNTILNNQVFEVFPGLRDLSGFIPLWDKKI